MIDFIMWWFDFMNNQYGAIEVAMAYALTGYVWMMFSFAFKNALDNNRILLDKQATSYLITFFFWTLFPFWHIILLIVLTYLSASFISKIKSEWGIE